MVIFKEKEYQKQLADKNKKIYSAKIVAIILALDIINNNKSNKFIMFSEFNQY